MKLAEVIFYVVTTIVMSVLIALCIIDPDYYIGKPLFKAETSGDEEFVEEMPEILKTVEIQCETVHFDCVMGFPPTEEETTAETTAEETMPETVEATTYYIIGDRELDHNIQDYLRDKLEEYGIGWYFRYALCVIRQESECDPLAEADNGQDKGLFQFRLKYWNWEWGDIFDPYAQINAYVANVARRLAGGRDIYTVISDHYTGEVGYSSTYVSDVLKWYGTIKEE